MKKHWRVLAAGIVAYLPSMSALAACASDESATAIELDAGPTVLPAPPDSGSDASPAEDAGADPCTPDALCPSGPFDPEFPGGPLDPRTRINVLRGRSRDDVWAVGAVGTVVHFDGTSWTRLDTGANESLYALWLHEGGELAMASLASVFTHGAADMDASAAGAWTARTATGGPGAAAQRRLTSCWAPPDAEWLWCALESVPVLGPTNGLWRVRVAPSTNAVEIGSVAPAGSCTVLPCAHMSSVHGISADDLWAVGSTGAIVHVTDAQSATPRIKAFDSQTWAGLNGVWAASENEAWAVGGTGVIRHYTGQPSSWDIVADVQTTENLRAVWGSSPSDVWAVGDGAIVLHYDGKSWSRVRVAGLGDRRPDLYTVWTSAPGHVWVGGDGVLLSLGGNP
ncbi:MAG: hypothetical protein BGO98_24555 [Myxococcales bacterium 68-20]|nr:MAG: hypothetical protein BGO98_24555 [Myxococcales bacterium 68-20]